MPLSPRQVTANLLKARLGAPFYCFQCDRTHRPGSQALQNCLERLTCDVDRFWRKHWDPSTRIYDQRLAYYRHNGLLSTKTLDTYKTLTAGLAHLRLRDQVPMAQPHDLASPHGLRHVRKRYHHWRRVWITRCQAAATAAAPLLAQLEDLLPIPYPVGPPTAHLRRRHTIVPNHLSAKEISRVATLLGPSTRRRTTDRTITLALPLRGTPYCAQGVPLMYELPTLLRTPGRPSFPTRSPNVASFAVEELGLDPRFWESVWVRRTTVTFTTHPFRLRAAHRPARRKAIQNQHPQASRQKHAR